MGVPSELYTPHHETQARYIGRRVRKSLRPALPERIDELTQSKVEARLIRLTVRVRTIHPSRFSDLLETRDATNRRSEVWMAIWVVGYEVESSATTIRRST
ncbi:hypothetical protein FA13DRAFT_1181202 [Coprinellus micaceus]|uniref:Uncharacterized protein n=1 Tax=Coprinellus micaceus TaxID=71717 RepID=A0A4Y7RC41_COPMI|nr:hypothetical protein FA13DRAFT_1181202 [Coprinellus micaceus]